jgi:predicted CxxxxCH...CXXCH cytochrome family protein
VVVAACSDERVVGSPCTDCAAKVHPPGILDPASDEFHGKELERQNWAFSVCATCHGENLDGGKAKVSCLKCHAEGPTACTTCHGPNGPTTNAHPVHLAAQLDCSECHIKPDRWDAPGHIIDQKPPAKVVFGAKAALATAFRKGPPTWDGERCTNIYCHADALSQTGGAAQEPRWDQSVVGGCDRCHLAPPPDHQRSDCATCHPASAPHIDGIVQVGRTSGCDGCHGSSASPAPPVDLAGNTSISAIGVGAHQAHLNVPSKLSGPIACATCHVVPATVTSPGHLDGGPAKVTASLGWDRTSQTCTTAYCHGPGRPVWTTHGQVACGTCHGIPPVTSSHNPTMLLTGCVNCHAATVDGSGNILVTNGTSHHMDGVVDAN